MTREELFKEVSAAVNDYIHEEESYDDNAQLCIEPADWKIYIDDSINVNPDSDTVDCYDVMDLVKMNPEGAWIVDEEAIESVVKEYV